MHVSNRSKKIRSMLLALCILVATLGRFVQRERVGPSTQLFIENRVDHFNPFNQDVFRQRYYYNSEFVRDGSHVAILEIGGEGEINSAPGGTKSNPDILGRIADNYGAHIFVLEHRFYGISHPFQHTSEKYDVGTDKLRYLSSKQAQSDLLYFISVMDDKLCPANSKDGSFKRIEGRTCLQWVIVGGSYPGAVTGWIYQRHPNLFAAGLSSSGVVNARYEIPEFDTHTLMVPGAPCSDALYQAQHEATRQVEAGEDNIVYERLGIRADADKSDIHYFIADTMLMCFQYGKSKSCCDSRLSKAWEGHGDILDALVDYLSTSSFDSYDSINLASDTAKHSDAFRQWWWQTCTEVAYYQPAPLINSLRSEKITTQWHLDMCKKIFDGLDLGNPTIKTNEFYGGEHVKADNVFFSNFWQDPWHMCSMTDDMGGQKDNIGFIRCKDCGHCVDLHLPQETDPVELVELRDRIYSFIVERVDSILNRVG